MALKLIRRFDLPNGEAVLVYQGEKSSLDIRIKYRDSFTPERNHQGRQLSHTVWTVALLMKRQGNRELTYEYVKYLIDLYDNKVKPFKNKKEQCKCEVKYATNADLKRFRELDKYGQFSVELLTYIMELLTIEELNDKINVKEVYMFRNLLQKLLDEDDIYSIIGASRYAGR